MTTQIQIYNKKKVYHFISSCEAPIDFKIVVFDLWVASSFETLYNIQHSMWCFLAGQMLAIDLTFFIKVYSICTTTFIFEKRVEEPLENDE